MSTISPLFSWRSVIVESDLPSTTKHVALTLSLHMSERGDSCFPSIATLCRETGLARSTVCDHLKALEDAGLLDREPGTKGRTTRYRALAVVRQPDGGVVRVPDGGSPPAVHEVVKDHDKDLSPASPSKEERDAVWDALEVQFGKPTTDSHRKRFGKVQRELLSDRSLAPREVATQIAIRAARYRRIWPGVSFTLEAFAKHWPDLGSPEAKGTDWHAARMPELPEGETF